MLIHLACSDDMLPRSSRAADINRLLDPSYSSSSSSASSSSAHSHRAYVDHHGDLHDPDYRHFPAVTNKRHSSPFTARPHWARDDTDTDEPEYADDAYLYRAPRRVASLTRYYSPSSSPSSDSTLRSASPSALPFSDDKQRWRWRTKGPASITSIIEDETDEYEPEKQQQHQQQKSRISSPVRTLPNAEDDDEDAEPHMEWTPTCTDTLRRHWQAISLRFRFSVFRAKRRMRNRVNSLL